ncbi:YkgJ family cysteine cluster protein [bacterium]|nr:YkgJ family cysteine cluster protein [bacterium]
MDEFDCLGFDCRDACCRYGADVYPAEMKRLIDAGLARPSDFTGPDVDEEDEVMYRTRATRKGCVFLGPGRGCRLHATKLKPSVCSTFPLDEEEALEMHEEGAFPCYHLRFSPAQRVAVQGG